MEHRLDGFIQQNGLLGGRTRLSDIMVQDYESPLKLKRELYAIDTYYREAKAH